MTSQTEVLGLSSNACLDRAADLDRAVDAALKARTHDFSLHEQMRKTAATLLTLVSLRAQVEILALQAEALALQAIVAEAAAKQQKVSS